MNKKCEKILKELETEGKLKVWWDFKFPEKEELKLRLKDMLEDEVDEKYYLSEEISSKYIPVNESGNVKGKLVMNKWQDNMKRIYDIEKYSPAIHTCQGGNTEPKIITHNIPQTVIVRKYEVDTEKLKKTLRNHKNITNKEIAAILQQPLTKVEHWFRTDNSFAIPDKDIWIPLKTLLKIETDEFDESIITFEEREGVYEKADRVYDEEGLSPTLQCNDNMRVVLRNKNI